MCVGVGQGMSKALKGEVVQGMRVRTPREERSSKEGMCIGKKREVVEKGRDVLGGAPRAGPIQLKSERFCEKRRIYGGPLARSGVTVAAASVAPDVDQGRHQGGGERGVRAPKRGHYSWRIE